MGPGVGGVVGGVVDMTYYHLWGKYNKWIFIIFFILLILLIKRRF
jgi:hypothetical protein